MKTLGILGGMGPEATMIFFQKIIKLTPAQYDQQHIPCVIYNNTQIPDRTKSILNHDNIIINYLENSIKILVKAKSDFICIPCNTAHYYFEEMQQNCPIPIINIIDNITSYILLQKPQIKKVGLLATIGTIQSKLYTNAFAKHNIDIIIPDNQDVLQNEIYKIKNHSNDLHLDAIKSISLNLIKKGAQIIILGCTELSIIASRLYIQIPLLDSLELLAKKAISLSLNYQI